MDWSRIDLEEFYLINNVWGKGGIDLYEQSILSGEVSQPYPLGWRWNWPSTNLEQVKGYPSLSYGWMPWSARSTVDSLPAQVGRITELSVELDIEGQYRGKYNLAFDLWISAQPENTSIPEEGITREIMLWLEYARFDFPRQWFVETVSLDGENWDYYRAPKLKTTNYQRDFLVFLRQSPLRQGTVPILSFLNYLLDRGDILPEEYLRNIDLGNEVWYGVGETKINRFQVKIAESP